MSRKSKPHDDPTSPAVPAVEDMLRDGRPSHLMDFFVRLRFGRLHPCPALQSAFKVAVGRHPLLRAVVCPGRRGRLQWCPANEE